MENKPFSPFREKEQIVTEERQENNMQNNKTLR